uniref:Uncharacterized protein n=1 Tax=viral metagenome TaxID=1070528 RepID=A0A6C0FCN4_9ZZZZ|tara:strand:- start:38 stop:676 length:639 start_codon:yes stop_codon:yes gene_type:complete
MVNTSGQDSTIDYDRLKSDIKDQVRGELIEDVNDMIRLQNDKVENDLVRMRQSIREGSINENDLQDDQMDQLLNVHMRDITRETRPQMSSAGLEEIATHSKDLSNHELHQIKKIHEKDHMIKPKTILDESLGNIMNKLVNFLTYSFDGYTKAYYEAEVMEDVYDNDKSTYQMIKVNLIAIIIFMRKDQNILYIGILLVLLSIIIYLVNITTS